MAVWFCIWEIEQRAAKSVQMPGFMKLLSSWNDLLGGGKENTDVGNCDVFSTAYLNRADEFF